MLCLVTNRHSLGGSPDAVVEQAGAAVAAGVDLFHIRERDLEAADLSSLVRRVLETARQSKTRVVVNDRLDVALASAADGVHLRHDSFATAAARRLAPPPFLIGRSIHTVAEAAAASGADYLAAGTVFRSLSKPEARRCLGVDGLRAIVAATTVPILAIGGILLDNISDVAAAGVAGIAAIGLFATTDAAAMCAVAEAARRRFEIGLTA